MPTITLTAKRQATFPVETCTALGLQPGDTVDLEPSTIAGEKVWLLRPKPVYARKWAGSLIAYGRRASTHDMDAIRTSIAAGRRNEPAA